MSARNHRPGYSELRVRLPTFLIMAIREMVREANAAEDASQHWTLPALLERWLLDAIPKEEMEAIAKRSPKFKRAALAWVRVSTANLSSQIKAAPTKLEAFLIMHGIRARYLAEVAGIDVRGFRSIRMGKHVPQPFTRECITGAASRILGRPVALDELFD